MTELKCPFCHKKLQSDDLLCSCINEKCEESFDMVGTELLWQKVIDLQDDLLALETELAKCKKQVKKLRKQNRTLTESLGEYFNRWIDANIQALKNKDQIRHLTEQEQARHQAIIDQIKGGK